METFLLLFHQVQDSCCKVLCHTGIAVEVDNEKSKYWQISKATRSTKWGYGWFSEPNRIFSSRANCCPWTRKMIQWTLCIHGCRILKHRTYRYGGSTVPWLSWASSDFVIYPGTNSPTHTKGPLPQKAQRRIPQQVWRWDQGSALFSFSFKPSNKKGNHVFTNFNMCPSAFPVSSWPNYLVPSSMLTK